MDASVAKVIDRGTPILAVALHAGTSMREELLGRLRLERTELAYEEDPGTDRIMDVGCSTIVAGRSRFEADLNRPRTRAIHQGPEDAWGLDLWSEPLDPETIARSLEYYDAFYQVARELIERTIDAHGYCVVFDVHSYNHRRSGPMGVPADLEGNPEVNLGTRSIDTAKWGHVVQAFTSAMSSLDLDVRENVKFMGGQFPTWVNQTFSGFACALAIEFKKNYMDEWTGVMDELQLERRRRALLAAADSITRAVHATNLG